MEKISIIICTYNRSEILKEAILSILANCKNYNSYEILVIDNNSKDNTKDVVYKLIKENNNIKYYKEEKQGLSAARNKGIKVNENKILGFIDDDVLITDDFIENINKFFQENKKAVTVGGKIITLWTEKKPIWFNDGFFSIIGETKYGEERRELIGEEYPYGGNMFFKKEVFDEVGYFNEDLGLKGEELTMGEEVDLFTKIKAKGHKVFYEPKIMVNHRIHINKVDKTYIVKRWIEEGKATGKIISENQKEKIFSKKIKRYLILLGRDYPAWIVNKFIAGKNEFYYYAKIQRSKAIIENLK